MIMSTFNPTTAWGADGNWCTIFATRSVSEFREFICDLIEAGEDVVRELDLGNSGSAGCSYSNTEPYNSLFRQGRIEYPGRA